MVENSTAVAAIWRLGSAKRLKPTSPAPVRRGLGFGMLAFFGATLRSGFEIVTDAIRLRERLKQADWCITGEGRFDASTLSRQNGHRRCACANQPAFGALRSLARSAMVTKKLLANWGSRLV